MYNNVLLIPLKSLLKSVYFHFFNLFYSNYLYVYLIGKFDLIYIIYLYMFV